MYLCAPIIKQDSAPIHCFSSADQVSLIREEVSQYHYSHFTGGETEVPADTRFQKPLCGVPSLRSSLSDKTVDGKVFSTHHDNALGSLQLSSQVGPWTRGKGTTYRPTQDWQHWLWDPAI